MSGAIKVSTKALNARLDATGSVSSRGALFLAAVCLGCVTYGSMAYIDLKMTVNETKKKVMKWTFK